MSKRACVQTTVAEIKAKLRKWKANPGWKLARAAKELKTPRTTLSDWKKRYWDELDAEEDPEDANRYRADGGGRKHRMTPFEDRVLTYYDRCLREDGSIQPPELRKYCLQIPEFAKKEEKSQWTWVYRFIDRYKPKGTTSGGGEPRKSNDDTTSDDICTGVTPVAASEHGEPDEKSEDKDEESTAVQSGGSAAPTRHEENDNVNDEVDSDESWEIVGHVGATTEGSRPNLRKRKVWNENMHLISLTHQVSKQLTISIPVFQDDLDSLGAFSWVSGSIIDYFICKELPAIPNLILSLGTTIYTEIEGMVEQAGEESSGPGDVDWPSYKFVLVPISGEDHWSFVVIERPLQPGTTIFYHINSLPKYHASHRVLKILREYFDSQRSRIAGLRPKCSYVEFSYATKPSQTNGYDCALYMIHYMHQFFRYVAEKKPSSMVGDVHELVASKFNATKATAFRETITSRMERDIATLGVNV